MNPCHAELHEDVLTLSTGRVERTFRWNQGHLISQAITDLKRNIHWPLGNEQPDAALPDQDDAPADGSLQTVDVPATSIQPAHLRATVDTRLGELHLRRVFRLYPNAPAIRCDFHLRGKARSSWRETPKNHADLSAIESEQAKKQGGLQATVMDHLVLPHHHVTLRCAEFFDITDRRNNLLVQRDHQPYLRESTLRGNILLVRDRLENRGIFIIKEAPCSDVQLAYPGADFVTAGADLKVVGLGLVPEDLREDQWTRAYGHAVGIARGGLGKLRRALRRYQQAIRTNDSHRDQMIMLNTWGDRSGAGRIHQTFILEEIAAAKKLGLTHFQIDHGWECTNDPLHPNPPHLENIWGTPTYWDVNPNRFPDGLQPVVDACNAAGIELCIWFNPLPTNNYARWQDDANVLIGLHQHHGIRIFKIDGVQIESKQAEINFRKFLDTVLEQTHGQAVFNLDVTAGHRFGYHYFNEYGNYFLENRYTDWSNYYPHWTLRNLWMLSQYVPSQTLQVEFLNKWRNANKYPADDPLAPQRVPWDYCFAATMMAQPLAWFEASQLPPEAMKLAPVIREYRKHQRAIHAGRIFPIGDEPDGTRWTGFQSNRKKSGYVLVFRENNDQGAATIHLRRVADRKVSFEHVLGNGKSFRAKIGAAGNVNFELPQPFTFGLWSYNTA